MLRNIVRKVYCVASRVFPPLQGVKRWYLRSLEPKRYRQILAVIRKTKATKIMEIGTWTGQRATEMIADAARHHNPGDIEYYGFDLFELLDDQTFEKELSKESHAQAAAEEKTVEAKLKKTGARIHLYRGNTRSTLPKLVSVLPKMDLIFIDGGHSLETIANDWRYAEMLMHEHTIVIFDDYWEDCDDAGCKRIIEGIDGQEFKVEILPIRDTFTTPGGLRRIRLVRVRRRK